MNRVGRWLVHRAVWLNVLALVAAACASAPTPSPTPAPAKATQPPAAATALSTLTTAPAAQPVGKPEKTSLKVGVPIHYSGWLSIYLAAERTLPEEGLHVELQSFNGEAGLAQALASDSVDIALASLEILIRLINGGGQVKAFYAGLGAPGFEWFAQPGLRSWAELKGRTIGISQHGTLTDSLTRVALGKHGLEPERDVQIQQVGVGPSLFTALKARTVDAAILPEPFKWQAEGEGFARLGAQSTEVAEDWPGSLFIAKERFLADHSNTVHTLLRAHVKAIRLAKTDREAAVQTLMSILKYERPYAERAHAESIAGLDERGMLPVKGMPTFWEITMASGDVTEPWPEARFLDRRFIDTFDDWAPK